MGRAGRRRKIKTLLLQSNQNEAIDIGKIRVFHLWWIHTVEGLKGPMSLIGSSLFNPTRKKMLRLGRKRLALFRGWHDVIGILTEQTLHQGAGLRVPRHDRTGAGGSLQIQTQVSLALRGIRSVAVKTVLGQKRPNVLVE